MRRIVISGNISSGKTSQISLLQDYFADNPDVSIIPEDVENWIKEGWLEKFYQDMTKYSTGFQFRVLKSYRNLPTDNKIQIIERCVNITEHVFCKQLMADGFITPAGYRAVQEYNKIYGWLPDIFIYIRAPPEVCHQRISERSRNEEKNIPLEYLAKLHDKHEAFHGKKLAETYIIDGTQSKSEIFEEILKIINIKKDVAECVSGCLLKDKES